LPPRRQEIQRKGADEAASARIKPIAVLVTVNYLEINGLTLTYIAGH
jgi:hypothetical protein